MTVVDTIRTIVRNDDACSGRDGAQKCVVRIVRFFPHATKRLSFSMPTAMFALATRVNADKDIHTYTSHTHTHTHRYGREIAKK